MVYTGSHLIRILKERSGKDDGKFWLDIAIMLSAFLPSLELFLLGFLLESFCSAVTGCTFSCVDLKR